MGCSIDPSCWRAHELMTLVALPSMIQHTLIALGNGMTLITQRWLAMFRTPLNQRRNMGISRGGLYQRVILLLSLELWLRKYCLSW